VNLKISVEIFWMGQTNTAWKQKNRCQKTTYNKTCFATMAMDSFRGAKPALDKTPKTENT
jgi:hypothetical protein